MYRYLFLACLTVTAGCASEFSASPLNLAVAGDRIIFNGEIDSASLDAFEDIVEDHPDIRILVLQNVGGSLDDEANLEMGRIINNLGFATIVPAGGMVASGGTDLFLAGRQRIVEPGACIGVHSWAADGFTATDIPQSSPEHDLYLDYYEDVDIDEAFYWYTLQAAPADDIHWMTSGEVAHFGVATHAVSALSSNSVCDFRQ